MAAKEFVVENKRAIISFAVLFIIGIAIGIYVTLTGVFGEITRIAYDEIVTSSVKVFFKLTFWLVILYFLALLSPLNFFFSLLSLASIMVFGVIFGKYLCFLIGVYGMRGIINLIAIYLWYFIISLILLSVAIIKALCAAPCGDHRVTAILRPAIKSVASVLLLNVCIVFVLCFIIGIFVKVIII